MTRLLYCTLAILLLSSCSDTLDRLKRVGKKPELAKVELPSADRDPEEESMYQDQMDRHRIHMRKTNSLWQPGSVTFFRDIRAWKVGDIITVTVAINDSAKLDNTTQQKRSSGDTLAIPKLFGKEKVVATVLSKSGDPTSLVSTSGTHNHNGSGNISRKEAITTTIAAVVTKILPNGNLVIQGHQEVRVNHELREVRVAGMIRPKDISSENSIHSSQIAEARISYGGRGVVSDMQQPRVGAQVLDAVSPF